MIVELVLSCYIILE